MDKLFFNIALLLLVAFHPLHVSVSNLDYQDDKHVCLLVLKVFSDDFAEVIRQREGLAVLEGRDSLSIKDNPIIRPYLKENVQIRLDGQLFEMDKWRLDSVKNNFEASWLFYSMEYNGLFKEISIRNSIFFDHFSDQKNLVIIGNGNEEKAFQINKRKPVITFRY